MTIVFGLSAFLVFIFMVCDLVIRRIGCALNRLFKACQMWASLKGLSFVHSVKTTWHNIDLKPTQIYVCHWRSIKSAIRFLICWFLFILFQVVVVVVYLFSKFAVNFLMKGNFECCPRVSSKRHSVHTPSESPKSLQLITRWIFSRLYISLGVLFS